jgi:hypothetical protein
VSGKMGSVDLDSIAGKLYGVSPDAFTSSRSAEVRAARSAGDRELAAAVAQLRRPTVGAWLANQLARECKDELEALLDLGTSMRKAQEAGDGPELRLLARQRREMVAGLVSEARRLARTRDQPLSENSTRELENTLEAAVATADAADALRSGRLNVGLTYSGFGPLDLGAPLVTKSSTRPVRGKSATPGSAEKPKTSTQPSSPGKGGPRPQRSKTARPLTSDDRSRLKLDLVEAEQKVKSAEDVVGATQHEAEEAQTECNALRDEIVAAERHVRETKKRLEQAQHRLVEAKQADKIARKEALRAKSQRDKAETSLHHAMSRKS